MNKTLYLAAFFLIIFTGCSTKQYFEPEDTFSFKEDTLHLDASIIDLNTDGATLDNNQFVSKIGVIKNDKEGYKFLNFSDDTVLSSDSNGSISLNNQTTNTTIQFDKDANL